MESRNTERREMWASQLLSMIRMKLNPDLHGGIKGGTAAKKIYITTLFSKEDFLLLFPDAKEHKVIKNPKKIKSTIKVPESLREKFYVNGKLPEGFGCSLPKSTTTKKLYSKKYRNLRDLDNLFGEDWDLYFKNKDVGFVLPVFEIRLVETLILSYKTKMSFSDDGKVVTWAEGKTHTSLSITLNRGCLSRITPVDGVEKEWLPMVRSFQRNYEETQKRKLRYYSSRCTVLTETN